MEWKEVLTRGYNNFDEFFMYVTSKELDIKLKLRLSSFAERSERFGNKEVFATELLALLYQLFRFVDFNDWNDNLVEKLYKFYTFTLKERIIEIWRVLEFIIKEKDKVPAINFYYYLRLLTIVLLKIRGTSI